MYVRTTLFWVSGQFSAYPISWSILDSNINRWVLDGWRDLDLLPVSARSAIVFRAVSPILFLGERKRVATSRRRPQPRDLRTFFTNSSFRFPWNSGRGTTIPIGSWPLCWLAHFFPQRPVPDPGGRAEPRLAEVESLCPATLITSSRT